MTEKVKVAIIGPGNIGTDLMIKVMRNARHLEMGAMVGVDPRSEGLARAAKWGIPTTAEGIDGLLKMEGFSSIDIVFDATSASAHPHHNAELQKHGIQVVDLTPAAIGPYVIPAINLDEIEASNINMVTCGGQATIPMVAAVSSVTPAIIILNPAEPPLMMRDTVYLLTDEADRDAIRTSVDGMVARVQQYVPGYRLKQQVQFDEMSEAQLAGTPAAGLKRGLKVTVLIEVEGAAHYLPAYAGNLDIMTSAALASADRLASRRIAAGIARGFEETLS